MTQVKESTIDGIINNYVKGNITDAKIAVKKLNKVDILRLATKWGLNHREETPFKIIDIIRKMLWVK